MEKVSMEDKVVNVLSTYEEEDAVQEMRNWSALGFKALVATKVDLRIRNTGSFGPSGKKYYSVFAWDEKENLCE